MSDHHHPDQERLDSLQEEIDRAREDLDPAGPAGDGPQFVDPGSEPPVDDTIAPPG